MTSLFFCIIDILLCAATVFVAIAACLAIKQIMAKRKQAKGENKDGPT